MRHSRKLLGPIVAAGVATIGLASFSVISIVRRQVETTSELFGAIWPLMLTASVAVILVMSLLYKTLLEVVEELQASEAAAQHAALHDPLTGLPNRALMEDRLDSALNRNRRDGEKTALLMLDLDGFKRVNDSWGHAAGDDLLRQVGARLRSLLRETDTVARIGGDEFTILQTGPGSAEDVRRLCERILETLLKPYEVLDRSVEVGVSLGAALVGATSETPADIMRRADHLLYRAKSAGRGCYRISPDWSGSPLARAA